jgi:hypothetical protein
VSGAVGGGVAAAAAGYLGVTATTAATMTLGQAVTYGAVIGAASGGASGGATQIVDNVLNCRPWGYHVPEALLFGMGTGAVMGGAAGGLGHILSRTVKVAGFRGVGFNDPAYASEDALIKAGHVGVSFDGGKTIYGFHPSEQAMNYAPDPLDFLRRGGALQGQVYDDTATFLRAYQLSKQGGGTSVYQTSVRISAEEFAEMQASVLAQVENPSLTRGWYRFPEKVDGIPVEMPPQCNNCATWPRTLGLPIPEDTGQLSRYIPLLKKLGSLWEP